MGRRREGHRDLPRPRCDSWESEITSCFHSSGCPCALGTMTAAISEYAVYAINSDPTWATLNIIEKLGHLIL
jgi:hypothetical protein